MKFLTAGLSVVIVLCLNPTLFSQEIDFAHQIVPILKQNCATCHGGRESEGDFSINTRDDLLDSGMVELDDVDSSKLLELILSEDPDVQMPPSDRPRLTKDEVTLVRRWVEGGLKWEDGFTFAVRSYDPPLEPRAITLPPAHQDRNHPIDRLLDQYCVSRELAIPQPISDEVFLRRVYLDLVGLLPSPEARKRFLEDKRLDRRERLVDELLTENLAYADHWLSFFNDLLRNDYSGTGFITGGRKQISQWLYESLVENKPFDVMTRELVAPPSGESRGYIDGITWRGTVSAGQTLPIQFSQSISQSFLGINMKCASCHDSFTDRWTLKEAYGLGAIYADKPLELHRCDIPTGETQEASWLFPEIGQVDPKAPRDQRLAQLAKLMTHPKNGRYSRTIVNRLWHRMMGRGLVHPLDAMQSEPWHEDLLEFLANHFVENKYDLKATLRLIATSEAYQSKSDSQDRVSGDRNYVYRGPLPRRMTAEQFMDAVWQLTGSAPKKFDAPVFRGERSAELAENLEVVGKWVWGPGGLSSPQDEQLLVRKVIELPANVVSGGAVFTCDNEFTLSINNREIARGNDWTKPQATALKDSLKKGSNTLVFRVKNGGTSGAPNPAGLFCQAHLQLEDGSSFSFSTDESWEYHTKVPETRKGRMSAPADGWKPVEIVNPVAPWTEMIQKTAKPMLAAASVLTDDQPMVRASLMKNSPLMQSLGRPMRDQIVSMRPNQLTTLEAIDLANQTQLSESLEKGAGRLKKQSWHSSDELVDHLFHSALSRDPNPDERELFRNAFGENPDVGLLQDALWAICMLPEFILVR